MKSGYLNPLNAELNPICHLLALLGGATIVVVSWLWVNFLEPSEPLQACNGTALPFTFYVLKLFVPFATSVLSALRSHYDTLHGDKFVLSEGKLRDDK